ncbi:hypothetical protein G7Y89_g819 [Cudoniella acicularis]|uniref:Pre-rRNA-processing protein RIX1 n=1 Tax=Cudoniella acicularis TaxID=354080 RepID=A0A8H4RXB2_9HELO|nr:hypothetical protein G7Y89_g819 [Cudoniella acicularis]
MSTSLPPELRILCHQLSTTPAIELPRLAPTLLRYVSRCQAPLSSPAANAAKADAPAGAVLVHKLKTQLTTLLNGKSAEGRFAAVILIKGVVEAGGWEVLRGAESWVRGLLSLLGKPDPPASKELCIIALTKIYCMTHQYPTLLREITTPTLPAFVTSCLNMISSPASKASSTPLSLIETVFHAFSTLLPCHTTIYRPFATQIRLVTRPYQAPTQSDGLFVPSSLKLISRRLVIALHQTMAKNAGGEEWGQAVRDIVKEIHITSDHVFRAVVEDWESTAGYIAESVDVNQELCGGGKSAEDLPRWVGISAGVERLTSLLEILAQYFHSETSTPVSIPFGSIMDMVSRVLSIAIPSESSAAHGSTKLHPAVDRDERDSLWCGMPQIYVAALQFVNTVADRTQEAFIPLAPGVLDQLVWVFPSGRNTPEFRLAAYTVLTKVLLQAGQGFDRSQAGKLSPMIRSCCRELQPMDLSSSTVGIAEISGKKLHGNSMNTNQNADTFLQNKQISPLLESKNTSLELAASELLPLLLSHVPQQHLDISLRSLIERTAILTHHKNAMLSSILSPFVGKNGKAMTSILPHLTRDFGKDNVVEILLRPRMPLLPAFASRLPTNDAIDEESDDEIMVLNSKAESMQKKQSHDNFLLQNSTSEPGLGPRIDPIIPGSVAPNPFSQNLLIAHQPSPKVEAAATHMSDVQMDSATKDDVKMGSEDHSSDDESVHLNMELDTDSDSE